MFIGGLIVRRKQWLDKMTEMPVAYPAFLTFIKKRRIRMEKNNTFT